MDLETYKATHTADDAAPGWDAIDARLQQIYGDQNPGHWGTVLKFSLGGPDPLDGISAYRCEGADGEHLHFVTYGFSSLYYDEESAGADFSGFGFELTFRVRAADVDAGNPSWVLGLLQYLAKYVFKSRKWFEPNHWLDARGPLNGVEGCPIVAVIFTTDSVLGTIDTPHGKVEFLQIFGITGSELAMIKEGKITPDELAAEHRVNNPLLVTDMNRLPQ